MVEIKFCGMTREEDAREAAALGAEYVGAILAQSPRRVTGVEAKRVLAGAAPGATRVAVFGPVSATDVVADASAARVKVAQLHGDPTPAIIAELRALWNGKVWAVVRVNGTGLPAGADKLFDVAECGFKRVDSPTFYILWRFDSVLQYFICGTIWACHIFDFFLPKVQDSP